MFLDLRCMCLSLNRVWNARITIVAIVFLMLGFSGISQANMASPHAIHEIQPDGTEILLYIRGGDALHWQEDADGYTVLREGGNFGRYVYAKRGPDGHLAPTKHEVGKANPRNLGLPRRVLPSQSVQASIRARRPAGQSTATATVNQPDMVVYSGTLKNLVVLIRFADHATRPVPTELEIDALMNAIGGDPDSAPAGSLRDIYLNNSYGVLTIDSTVVAWATVSETEAYYAAGSSGLAATIHEALGEALDIVDQGLDFGEFDQDGDGYIDAITFLHSGYGAEWGGTDVYGAYYTNRIWSHKWIIYSLSPYGYWQSNEGVKVYSYHISPALWGTSGEAIGRIGVIAHETGHFLGLPDLYDTDSTPGNGIGSWGLMANSWGGDGGQQPPPLMSPWSKIQIGWLNPTDLYALGNYTIEDSLTSDQVYMVSDGFPLNEYLLIENRKRKDLYGDVVDNIPPSGDGLVIWHIDDLANYNTQGYPGQTGWPENGNHYRVAVLQADGDYDLEKGYNRGDSSDAYREGFVDAIGPNTIPSTDAYQFEHNYPTDHEITAISVAGASMSFDFNTSVVPPEPPDAPSALSAITTGHHSIDLSWTDNSGDEDGFYIERQDSVSSWSRVTQLGPDITTYGDTGLTQGTTYDYRVLAWNSNGESGYSNTASATTTTPEPPTAPTELTATAVSTNQIDLTWNSGANYNELQVQRKDGEGVFISIASLNVTATSYSDTGLSPATTYTYKLFVINDDGTAESNVVSATTDEGIVGKGIKLSKNADFSTDDRDFALTDTLYMKIWSEWIDFTNMRKAEYEVKVNKKRYKGKLTNNYDGTFTASLDLSSTRLGSGTVKLKLGDQNRVKYEVKNIPITITTG